MSWAVVKPRFRGPGQDRWRRRQASRVPGRSDDIAIGDDVLEETVSLRLFTSESVTEGHPDKIADRISDGILDALLAQDPRSRVAVETLVTTGQVHVAGEVDTSGYVDIPRLIRQIVLDIGYDSSAKGFDGASCGVSVSIGAQSPDIVQGVDAAHEVRIGGSSDELDRQGAGDQGLMFGFACDETPELMPLPITLAHRLAQRLTRVRKDYVVPYLRPDGKTQVTIEYDGDRPVRLDTVVVSSQHAGDLDLESLLTPDIRTHVVEPELAALDIDTSGYRLLVNPTGRFEIGGPMGDAGLTGRKIIVDTYGGYARHGGGAFSGKDPSKVDRSAAYAMRWVAKNVVAAELARRCEVQVAYAIGKAEPVGVFVETFGTGAVSQDLIQKAVLEVFDLRPAALVRDLDLLRPIYSRTAAYGHFGRELPEFTWERRDRVQKLREAVYGS
ncbi:methionine adenosyltransferase [Actinoplanes sp. NEAU-H7]|uniref:S-adenosylmethionine synthase n=1 Tax=Actinoplanes flavus TaxID=2820290 RepID=A0ABS3US32_9ACTN|nr:methionine adenosyltransferase [Actinoplanes flavus]